MEGWQAASKRSLAFVYDEGSNFSELVSRESAH
jgi:hypothetical protein